MTHNTPPPALVDDLRRLTASELSVPARLGYVGLLLGAGIMTTIVTALLLTEPSLPARTSIALGVLALIGLAWVAFAAWVLSRRRIPLGRDRVVAGRIAVVCTGVFCLGAALLAYVTGQTAAIAAAAMGAAMHALAIGILIKATRQVETLIARRAELERQLGRRRS